MGTGDNKIISFFAGLEARGNGGKFNTASKCVNGFYAPRVNRILVPELPHLPILRIHLETNGLDEEDFYPEWIVSSRLGQIPAFKFNSIFFNFATPISLSPEDSREARHHAEADYWMSHLAGTFIPADMTYLSFYQASQAHTQQK